MKKFITAIAFTATTLASAVSFSTTAASVSFPDSLAVTGINGTTDVNRHNATVKGGKNLIELKYYDIFEVNADDSGARVKSDALYLVVDLEGTEKYQAKLPQIDTEEEARAFLKDPMITITSDSGKAQQISLRTHNQLMTELLFSQGR